MLKISKDCQLGIGIDFGNTYSRVGIYYDQHFECLSDEIGNSSIPSYFHIDDHEKIAGFAAKQQAVKYPQNTLCNIKELIGKTAQQLSENKDLLLQNIKIESSPSPLFVFKDTTLKFKIEEIIAILFAKFKSFAEQFLENSRFINDVVITVPTIFGDIERLIIKDAARLAGFTKSVKVIRESAAAVLAYNSVPNPKQENVFVFDLGGSHLELSVYSIEEGSFEQLGAAGYFDLGGRDFDRKLMEYFVEDLQNIKKIDIRNNPRAMKRLENHCEKVKNELTFSTQTQIEVDSLYEGEDYLCKITRSKFEDLSSDLFHKISLDIDQILKQSGVKVQQLNQVILAGGASKIPRVTEIVKNYFKGIKINDTKDPERVGVLGAALQAAIDHGHDNTTREWFCCCSDLALLPLGIETSGGLMHVLIERSTFFPLRRKWIFTTSSENQTNVVVNLFEGYCPLAKYNHHIATVSLDHLPPAPRGVAKIEVTIDIDTNVNFKLIVTDVATGRFNELVVPFSQVKWQNGDVEKCLNDAEAKGNEYKQLREKMEALNLLESCSYYIRNKVNNSPEVERICCEEVIDWIKENPNLEKQDYQEKLEIVQEVFSNFMKQFGCTGDEILVLPRGLPSLYDKLSLS